MKTKKHPQLIGLMLLAFTLFVAAPTPARQEFGTTRVTIRKPPDAGTVRVNNVRSLRRGYSRGPKKTGNAGPEAGGAGTKQEDTTDYLGLGVKSFEGQQYDQALVHFNKRIGLNPTDASAYAYLGDTLTALKRFDEAVRNYTAAVSKLGEQDKEDKATVYFKMGLAYSEVNNAHEAVRAYRNAVSNKPDFIEAYNNMAVANMKLANWPEAINNYTTMLGLPGATPDADIYYNLGLAYEKLGRGGEAVESYNKSLALKENAETLLRVCHLNYTGRNWQGVLDACGRSIKLDESKGHLHFFLGDAYTELELYPQAAESYLAATQANPKDFEAFMNLGLTYSQMGRNADSAAAFREALKLDPNNVDTHFKLGQVYSNSSMWSEALAELSHVISSQPGNVKAYVLSGRASNRLDRMQEAIQFFKRALEVEPGNEEATYYLGTVYIKLKDQAAALEQYNQLRAANSPRAERLHNEIRQNFPAQ